MNKKKKILFDWWGGGQAAEQSPWWLGNGDVPESANYVVYDPLTAPDLSTSYINLANPGTKNAVPGVAPTHAFEQGWTFNGSTQYISTGQNPVNESTVIMWVERISGGTYMLGATGTGNHTYIMQPVNSTDVRWERNFTNRNVPPAMRGGIMGMTKSKAYRTGIPEANMVDLVGAINFPLYIGCQNNKGTAANFAAGRVLRFAYYDFTLSEAQMKAACLSMCDYKISPLNIEYKNKVMALNPTLYYPCNETTGTILLDHSGNEYHGEAYLCTMGYDGALGKGFKSDGLPLKTGRPNYKLIADQAVNDNELIFSCIYTPSGSVSPQVRLYETHHAPTVTSPIGDYVAFELRNGNDLSFYLREDGVIMNSGTLMLINTDPHHIVCYNSLSAGVWGIVVDGVKIEVGKLSTIGVTAAMTARYPYLNDESDSVMEQIVILPYSPSNLDAVINTLGLP